MANKMEAAFAAYAEEKLSTMSVEEKRIVFATLKGDYSWYDKTEVSEKDEAYMDKAIRQHITMNGPQAVDMTLRVGRAMKSSIQFPVKQKTGIKQKFQAMVRGILK